MMSSLLRKRKLADRDDDDSKQDSAELPKPSLYPVLPEELTENTPLTEVFVGCIVDPKCTSKVVISLNSVLPLMNLNHLKRIKNRQVLLFPVEGTVEEDLFEILKTKNFDTSLLQADISRTLVAAVPPKTRKQYDTVQKLWPCNFHSEKYLERLSNNTLFSESEISNHLTFMKIAVDVAKYSKAEFQSKTSVGVIVVDPKLNSIVAVGYDKTNENPCHHAVMVAVDNVALTQNGEPCKSVCVNLQECEIETANVHPPVEDLNVNGLPLKLLNYLSENYKSCKFGSAAYKRKIDLTDPADGPYLCTGYYVYVTHEPCIMCAMALIHSRAKRVFYGAPSAKGGLGSACKIHTVKDLNHHYEVFAGLLEEECRKL